MPVFEFACARVRVTGFRRGATRPGTYRQSDLAWGCPIFSITNGRNGRGHLSCRAFAYRPRRSNHLADPYLVTWHARILVFKPKMMVVAWFLLHFGPKFIVNFTCVPPKRILHRKKYPLGVLSPGKLFFGFSVVPKRIECRMGPCLCVSLCVFWREFMKAQPDRKRPYIVCLRVPLCCEKKKAQYRVCIKKDFWPITRIRAHGFGNGYWCEGSPL